MILLLLNGIQQQIICGGQAIGDLWIIFRITWINTQQDLLGDFRAFKAIMILIDDIKQLNTHVYLYKLTQTVLFYINTDRCPSTSAGKTLFFLCGPSNAMLTQKCLKMMLLHLSCWIL